jgi:pimeloyl-ACP methyl ester carboxylesterase
MRTEDGRWTWRYDRVLRNPANLKVRGEEAGWASCAAIDVQTLLVRGGQSDILSAATAERLVQTVADARLATIEESGHAVPLDAPDPFLAVTREFLKG